MSELHFARARDRNYDRNVYNGGMRLCWLCIWICVYYAILMEVNESKTIKCVYIIVECHITVEMIVQNMKFLIYIKENYLKIYIYERNWLSILLLWWKKNWKWKWKLISNMNYITHLLLLCHTSINSFISHSLHRSIYRKYWTSGDKLTMKFGQKLSFSRETVVWLKHMLAFQF